MSSDIRTYKFRRMSCDGQVQTGELRRISSESSSHDPLGDLRREHGAKPQGATPFPILWHEACTVLWEFTACRKSRAARREPLCNATRLTPRRDMAAPTATHRTKPARTKPTYPHQPPTHRIDDTICQRQLEHILNKSTTARSPCQSAQQVVCTYVRKDLCIRL